MSELNTIVKEIQKTLSRIEEEQKRLGVIIEAIALDQKESAQALENEKFNKVQETVKTKAPRAPGDIVNFVKNKYIENQDFFKEHVTDEQHQQMIEEMEQKYKSGKKVDIKTQHKRVANAIWTSFIKPDKKLVEYYKAIKTAESGGDPALGIPEVIPDTVAVSVDDDEEFADV